MLQLVDRWDIEILCSVHADKSYQIHPNPSTSFKYVQLLNPFENDCNTLPSVNTFRYHVYITRSRYKQGSLDIKPTNSLVNDGK